MAYGLKYFVPFLVSFDAFLVWTEEELAGHDAKARITVGEAGNAADLHRSMSGMENQLTQTRHDDTYQIPSNI